MDISFNYYKERSYSFSSISTVSSCESLKNLERSYELKPIKNNAFSDSGLPEYFQADSESLLETHRGFLLCSGLSASKDCVNGVTQINTCRAVG